MGRASEELTDKINEAYHAVRAHLSYGRDNSTHLERCEKALCQIHGKTLKLDREKTARALYDSWDHGGLNSMEYCLKIVDNINTQLKDLLVAE